MTCGLAAAVCVCKWFRGALRQKCDLPICRSFFKKNDDGTTAATSNAPCCSCWFDGLCSKNIDAKCGIPGWELFFNFVNGTTVIGTISKLCALLIMSQKAACRLHGWTDFSILRSSDGKHSSNGCILDRNVKKKACNGCSLQWMFRVQRTLRHLYHDFQIVLFFNFLFIRSSNSFIRGVILFNQTSSTALEPSLVGSPVPYL